MSIQRSLAILPFIFTIVTVCNSAASYHVSIRINGKHVCSGSIINRQHILTARSCVTGESVDDLTVIAGTESLKKGGTIYNVKEVIENERTDDIAILRLCSNIRYNSAIKSIKMAKNDDEPENPMILTGWAYCSDNGTRSDKLRTIEKQLCDDFECEEEYTNVDERHICIIDSFPHRKRYHIDFGGPLVSKGFQVGMKVAGYDCDMDKPEVYLRISYYAEWIKMNSKNIWQFWSIRNN